MRSRGGSTAPSAGIPVVIPSQNLSTMMSYPAGTVTLGVQTSQHQLHASPHFKGASNISGLSNTQETKQRGATVQAVVVPRRRSFHRLLAMGRAPVEQDDVSHRDLASMALFGASWCQGLIPLEPLRRAASDSAVPSNNQLPTYSQNELPSRVALDAHPSSPLSTGVELLETCRASDGGITSNVVVSSGDLSSMEDGQSALTPASPRRPPLVQRQSGSVLMDTRSDANSGSPQGIIPAATNPSPFLGRSGAIPDGLRSDGPAAALGAGLSVRTSASESFLAEEALFGETESLLNESRELAGPEQQSSQPLPQGPGFRRAWSSRTWLRTSHNAGQQVPRGRNEVGEMPRSGDKQGEASPPRAE